VDGCGTQEWIRLATFAGLLTAGRETKDAMARDILRELDEAKIPPLRILQAP